MTGGGRKFDRTHLDCVGGTLSEAIISVVESEEQLDPIRELLREYETLLKEHHPGASLEGEIAGLPGEYAPPAGACLLVRDGEQVAGCVVMRRLEEGVCEMRRLYVRPKFRGRGLGRVAAVALCREARRLGYRKMRLITIPFMVEAGGIYRSLGFREIPAYRPTHAKEPCYMEVELGRF